MPWRVETDKKFDRATAETMRKFLAEAEKVKKEEKDVSASGKILAETLSDVG